MPFLLNKEIATYKVEVFESNTLAYDRSIRLELANGHTVSIRFPSSAPTDYVNLGTSFHQVQMDAHKFDEVYHLLQTEKPVYFSAFEAGSPPIRFVGISTSDESTGEGLIDTST
jgi:hypothetical protein